MPTPRSRRDLITYQCCNHPYIENLHVRLTFSTMSAYTTNVNQESAKRSKYPPLRAIAAEFIPDPQGPNMPRTAEIPHGPSQPLIVASSTVHTAKEGSQDQMRRQRSPPQSLALPRSSAKNAFAARRSRQGKHRASCTLQRHTEWHYKLPDRSSQGSVPYLHSISDRPLYGVSPLLLQAANPFHTQIERIEQHRKMMNKGSRETARLSYERFFSV
jgi:hypothetical protein